MLLVSVSSVGKAGSWHDTTCILNQGDHPFVKHQSFVFYTRSRNENANKVVKGVKGGSFVPQDPLDQEVYERICGGMSVSPYTPKNILALYNQALALGLAG
ncbi:MAG: hypothetical protein HQL56_18715 [Magnetococcales bacterium]|nr:hypothetical protein [Magnetococcales bacterium]